MFLKNQNREMPDTDKGKKEREMEKNANSITESMKGDSRRTIVRNGKFQR